MKEMIAIMPHLLPGSHNSIDLLLFMPDKVFRMLQILLINLSTIFNPNFLTFSTFYQQSFMKYSCYQFQAFSFNLFYSEDSARLVYHLGMNVTNENEDSRQSFQSVTDSEISESDIARKSPSEPSQIVINESSGSFSITAPNNTVCCC